MTGIDVYRHELPSAGHTVIRTGQIELLVLKSELDDDAKEAAIARFLAIECVAVRRVNRTALKPTGAVYRNFLASVRPDADYVNRMLESRYARHFLYVGGA